MVRSSALLPAQSHAAMPRPHAPEPHCLLEEPTVRRQLVDSWDKSSKSVPTLQSLALAKCAKSCLLDPDFAMDAAERMPVSLFEVLGDIAKNILRQMGERGEGNKVSGWEGLFSPRPSWLQESLGGHPSLASSDARQVCPFLHPEFHRSVRQHGEAKTLSGCPCELLHLQLYSKKPVIQWMRIPRSNQCDGVPETWPNESGGETHLFRSPPVPGAASEKSEGFKNQNSSENQLLNGENQLLNGENQILSSSTDPSVDFEFEGEMKGITPLYVAATWGYPELVRYLLQKQANPSRRDARGMTPLRVVLVAAQESKVCTSVAVDRQQALRFKGLRYTEVIEILEAQSLEELEANSRAVPPRKSSEEASSSKEQLDEIPRLSLTTSAASAERSKGSDAFSEAEVSMTPLVQRLAHGWRSEDVANAEANVRHSAPLSRSPISSHSSDETVNRNKCHILPRRLRGGRALVVTVQEDERAGAAASGYSSSAVGRPPSEDDLLATFG
ncbi:unnamed protein product [Durusdinium trenchii]|uniref:Uncharacterized protein n=1 Tax=Durusdinium trenchii TaxID=1381693 RepID=A0ABP0N6F7_9DINO